MYIREAMNLDVTLMICFFYRHQVKNYYAYKKSYEFGCHIICFFTHIKKIFLT